MSAGYHRILSLALGPILGLLVWFLPLKINSEPHLLICITIGIFSWWVFSPLPLGLTALVAAACFNLFGLASLKEAFAPFSHPLIFLFLGGFFLAKVMEIYELDKRFALYLLSRSFVSSPRVVLLCLMFSVAFLSMWLSNTATTATFLPLVISIVAKLGFKKSHKLQGQSFMLALAYAATIGGMMTPVGSPPNLIAVALLNETAGSELSFVKWMLYSAPISILALLVVYLILSRNIYKNFSADGDFNSSMRQSFNKLGPLSSDQKRVLVIAFSLLMAWVAPGIIKLLPISENFMIFKLLGIMSEPLSAIIFSSLFFIIPKRKSARGLLTWNDAKTIDWGILLLFGGGLSLGSMIQKTGLAHIISQTMGAYAGSLSPLFFLFILALGAIFFTECTSKTAAANIIIPIAIATAQAINISPLAATLAATFACNMAFMLPIATPPNAIIYSSGKVTSIFMAKTGLVLNILCATIIALYIWFFFVVW